MCIGHAAGATAHANELCSSQEEFYPERTISAGRRNDDVEQSDSGQLSALCLQKGTFWKVPTCISENQMKGLSTGDWQWRVRTDPDSRSSVFTLAWRHRSHLVRTSDDTFDRRQVTELRYLCPAVFQEIQAHSFVALTLPLWFTIRDTYSLTRLGRILDLVSNYAANIYI